MAEIERTANLILENPLIGTIFRGTCQMGNHYRMLIETPEASMIWLESQASHPL